MTRILLRMGTARGRYTYYAARKNSKKRSAVNPVENQSSEASWMNRSSKH
uniref:50S ribosomal protein L33 n=1 Tax=Trichogramma kaykai TaxID=54128 RepID=A0ABD2X1B4_9HYME